MARILVIHGPNLNLLGTREPEIYGTESLDDVNRGLEAVAEGRGVGIEFFQTNAEDAMVERVHRARSEGVSFILLNPGAFTHTSIALRDALLGVDIPFIEVHLSNVHSREPFRQHSYLSDVASGVIVGLGTQGYTLALEAALTRLGI
jgi:3-dehydroquinate dehydratase-2